MKGSLDEFGRFVVGAIINTGLTYALFLVLQVYFNYSIAYSAAFLFGIGLSYAINALFVFGGRHSIRAAIRFPLVYIIQYFYGAILLAILIETFGASNWMAMLIVMLTSAPLTYALVKRVFELHRTDGPFPVL